MRSTTNNCLLTWDVIGRQKIDDRQRIR